MNVQDFTLHRPTKWTDRLALDVALLLENSGETLQEVLDRHELTSNDLLKFRGDPIFLRRVDELREEVRSNGLTFKFKARAQAEELLKTSWLLIHDPSVAPSVKADLIKSTVKWAGLEPKGNDAVDLSSGGGVSITINLGGQKHDAKVIDHVPEDNVDESAHIEFQHDV